jgi:hypothetical protein
VSPASSPSGSAAPVRLGIRKSSRLVPIVLLLLTVALFIAYALPSGYKQLGLALGLIKHINDPLAIEAVKAKLFAEGALTTLWTETQQKDWSFYEYFTNIGLPAFKIYLEQLGSDLVAKSSITTVVQLGLFSLIPGVAGLIYRRSFWAWFLASFAILVGINASGVFGKLTSANVMPLSGSIFYFLASQLGLLLLAFRLRRHAQSVSFKLSPQVHNWGLTGILAIIGLLCFLGWGPGYSATGGDPGGIVVEGGDALAPDTTGSAEPAAVPVPVPAEAPKAADAPASKLVIGGSTGPVAKRSWIWSFLGSGIMGWFYRWEFILLGLPLAYTLLRNSSNWTTRTNKNIIICLDGTSNTPDQLESGFASFTNVFRLFRMRNADASGGQLTNGQFDASLCKKYKDKQIAFYYAGVGNKYDNDPLAQVLGLATGAGASEIIERAYLDLVRVYQPGDRVFITGFSRGAAIARLIARTIDARGAPRWLWTLKLFGKHRTLWTSQRKDPVKIDVLGCWDTVGSFGVAKTIAGINFQQLNLFRDLTVPDNVFRAYHMLALDEERDGFEPTLMDPDPIHLERIVEVWFTGDHANIGGGWATDSLSEVTMDFLLRHVSSGYCTRDDTESLAKLPGDEAWGIFLTAEKKDKLDIGERVEDDPYAVDPDPLGQARHWFSSLYKYRPRTLPLHAVISDTVFDRMTKSLPVYAPQALFKLNDEIDNKRDTITEKVKKLGETASLTPEELARVIEYKDKLRLRRWSEYWADVLVQRQGKIALPPVLLDNAALERRAPDSAPNWRLGPAAAPAGNAAKA